MSKIGPWIDIDGGAMRVLVGGDPDNINHRVAFIEKTPRVRIRDGSRYNQNWEDFLNWAARSFSGDGPQDPESRQWCDDMLKLLGYEE